MHIARRTSGGRGEYEISGGFEGGLQAKDLLGRVICLDIGGGLLINSALVLKSQGGKLRLRRAGAEMQVQRQLAVALLMPESVRADAALGAAAPVIQSNRYAISVIEIKNALLIPPDLTGKRKELEAWKTHNGLTQRDKHRKQKSSCWCGAVLGIWIWLG